MTGAHPKAVQAVMRHSSITLTMDTYGHLFPGQEADTVSRFPNMIDGDAGAQQATGTAGASANNPPHSPPQLGRDSARDGATPCNGRGPAGDPADDPNVVPFAELCEAVRDGAAGSDSAPKGRLLEPPAKISRARSEANRHAL